MKKAIVILTQSIEKNTSSMIRSRSILEKISIFGYKTICYSPYSNTKLTQLKIPNVEIRRYGEINYAAKIKKNIYLKKGIKPKVVSFIYRLYKKIDIFGASLQYLKYIKELQDEIKKEKPELLFTFSDPMTTHIIGSFCSKYAFKYIQQWGDPLAIDTISKIGLPVWIRKIIEKKLIKNADLICYVSPFTFEEQQKIYKKYAKKMIFLPTPSLEYQNIQNKISKKLKIGYFGSYNSIARNIKPLYEAALKNLDIELYLIGDSDIKLKEEKNIILIDRLSQERIENYLYEMDVLVCLLNSKGNQIPGKVYHYAGSYKEILIIKDGEYGNEIEKYFSQFNRYTFVLNDSKEINLIFDRYLIEGVPERKPIEEFSSTNITRSLIENVLKNN